MDNDFLLLLQAKLEEASLKGVKGNLDQLKKEFEELKIKPVLDQQALSNIVKQLESITGKKITIPNIEFNAGQTVKEAQKTAQQIVSASNSSTATIIQNEQKKQQAIQETEREYQKIANDKSLVRDDSVFKQVFGTASGEAKKAQEHFKTLLEDEKAIVTVNEKFNDSNALQSFTVNIKRANGEVESLRYAMENLEKYTGKANDWHLAYQGGSINDANAVKQFEQLEKKATEFTNKLNDLKSKLTGTSFDFSGFENILTQFRNGEITVNQLSTAFNQLKNSAETSLKSLNSQSSSFNPIQQTQNNMRDLPPMITSLETNMNSLKDKTALANVSVQDLTSTYNSLKAEMDAVGGAVPLTDEWTAKYRELMSTVTALTEQVKTLKKIEASDNSAVKLANQANKIQLSMDNGHGASEYQNRINAVTASLEKYGVKTEEAKKITDSLQSTFDSMKGLSGQELVTQADKLEQEFKSVKASVDQAKLSYDKLMQPVPNEKATSLINRINNFLTKNTKITKDAKIELQGYADELGRGVNLSRWNEINGILKKTENSMRGLGKLGASLKDQMSQAAESFAQWLSVSSAVMLGVSKTKEAVSELIELDSILTEISKTSDLTSMQLKELGDNAFESASKYGRSAADYLTGVQEMYRAGFDNADEMAELSLLAQAAGDMASNSANDYIMATNAAYDYKGSVEELNKVLDSQNYITNNAAVSMQDMADATSEAASIAAQYGVKIDELSALIAVATSKTRESGSEVGNALKSIFVTLQDTTSKPVVEAFDSVGISMTKIVDGAERLKTPIELLKELSDAFNELPEGDTKRANILTDIGKKYHANTLSAILSDWEAYESMLTLYSQGMGSAAKEAEKSANNIEGSLKRLGNTWTDTVENVINSDAILTVVNALNGLLSVVNKVTDALGSLETIGLGAGLFAGLKNVGRPKMFGLIYC